MRVQFHQFINKIKFDFKYLFNDEWYHLVSIHCFTVSSGSHFPVSLRRRP